MNKRAVYIQERRPLFWSVSDQKLTQISDELLVETILNYGTLEDVKSLFDVLGLAHTARIFYKTSGHGRRSNYFPEVANFFNLYFERYAPGNSV
jgi:hypothetical protein